MKQIPEKAGCLIVTDGVFSMGGDIAKLPGSYRLAKKYGARVMVDDAHGLGVIGDGGRGTANYFGLQKEVDISPWVLFPSRSPLGGFMAADEYVIDYVRHISRPFIFSASITPASCASALAALRYLRLHPEIVSRLGELSHYAREGLIKRGIKIHMSETPIIPIYTTDTITTLTIAKRLFDEGVLCESCLAARNRTKRMPAAHQLHVDSYGVDSR